jgi:hypothetical protein
MTSNNYFKGAVINLQNIANCIVENNNQPLWIDSWTRKIENGSYIFFSMQTAGEKKKGNDYNKPNTTKS